ncbi:hypothetical protein C8R44DRAFT_631256 [Mycena epipterygia]|nr:hypothetical protein C8R44DRAFT_631256 [Mycena epipterygia]
MHLARVSLSALNSTHTSPRTWAEVFWISNRTWQGPVGILSTFVQASRLRVRTSIHFLLCAITCLTALCTPIILSHAYPVQDLDLPVSETNITAFALSVAQMAAVDAYTEIGTGVGSWSTGLSVAEAYAASVYLPESPKDNLTDFFFAGDVEEHTATLPGLRLRGQCVPVETNVTDIADFPAYCEAQKLSPESQCTSKPIYIAPASVDLTIQFCYNMTRTPLYSENNPSLSTNVGYVYIKSSNTTNSVSGIIRCNSQTATGNAMLSGATDTYTYSLFSQQTLYKQTQDDEPLVDPLYAFFYYFNNHSTTTVSTSPYVNFTDATYRASVMRGLGFVGHSLGDRNQTYTQPSLDVMATGIWEGISHTVAGIALLSRAQQTFSAKEPGTVAAYVREKKFAIAAYTLLGVWLFLLIAITARSFRPTFAPSFDSYATARLVQDRPNVLDSSDGELNLREAFERVGGDGLGFGRVGREGHRRVAVAEPPRESSLGHVFDFLGSFVCIT